MSENLYRALWAWMMCVGVTVLVSLATKPRPASELEGLVMGVSALPTEEASRWYQEPLFWGSVVGVLFVALNVVLW
jgi:SSS family solute:Na+ symporter